MRVDQVGHQQDADAPAASCAYWLRVRGARCRVEEVKNRRRVEVEHRARWSLSSRVRAASIALARRAIGSSLGWTSVDSSQTSRRSRSPCKTVSPAGRQGRPVADRPDV